LRRSTIRACGEERAVRASNVNLNHLRSWRNPTDRGGSSDGVARDYRIWIRGQGGAYGGTRRVGRRYTGVAHEGIGAGRGQILDIEARSSRGVVNRNLYTRISNDEVLPKEISRSSRKQYYPICIPDNNVLLDDVAGSGGAAGRTNAEVITWS
jgi:hypothetical protein